MKVVLTLEYTLQVVQTPEAQICARNSTYNLSFNHKSWTCFRCLFNMQFDYCIKKQSNQWIVHSNAPRLLSLPSAVAPYFPTGDAATRLLIRQGTLRHEAFKLQLQNREDCPYFISPPPWDQTICQWRPLCLPLSHIALLLLSILGTMPASSARFFRSPGKTRANFCPRPLLLPRWHDESHDLWMHVRGGRNKTAASFLNCRTTFPSSPLVFSELRIPASCNGDAEQIFFSGGTITQWGDRNRNAAFPLEASAHGKAQHELL